MKVNLDSRLIKKGEYFVPVKGEIFDGHKFVDAAIANGAPGIIEEDQLYKLAQEKLQKINPKVIAVTGSVGKSTMCNFITTLLSTKYKVCQGTLNTKLGLATNIINNLEENDEFFVAETGMDRAGELTETGTFLSPHIAVLTNISESHMEKLGSLEAIKNAKSELFRTVRQNGAAFLNWDNQNVRSVINKIPSNIKIIKYDSTKKFVLPNIFGDHNISNANGAAAVAEFFAVEPELIESGLSKLKNPKGRLNIIGGINGSILIDDTYNSSPVSAEHGLKAVASYFDQQKLTGRKIAIMGGMLELGDFENEGHKRVGDIIADTEFDQVVLVGDLSKKISNSEKLSKEILNFAENTETAINIIKLEIKLQKGDIIYFKASQGIRLEKVVEALMADPSKAPDLLVRQDVRWKS